MDGVAARSGRLTLKRYNPISRERIIISFPEVDD
jgi:hypothetical protein